MLSWGRSRSDGAEASIDRANVMFMLPSDTGLWMAPRSRNLLRKRFEWLRQNFGIVQEMVAGIARHTVGKGLSVQFNTTDTEWNRLAEEDVERWALTPDRCDAGGRRNFYEAQIYAVESFIGPGEFFARDVENPRWDGEPCFQLFDPHEIQTPEGNLDPRVLDGIRVDEQYRPVEIFSREGTATGSVYKPSPAEQWTHWMKPTTANQVRGITPFAPAVANLADIHEMKRLTVRTAKAQALIAVMLKGFDKKKSKGAVGAIRNLGASAAGFDGSADTAAVEQLYEGAGGAIAYVDKDGDAKLLASNAPSPLVEPFISDLLLRDVCLAPGVPVEFFWAPHKLSGSNQRFIMERADLLFDTTGDALIYRWVRRQIFRYVSHRIATKKLRAPTVPTAEAPWWDTMDFQRPKRLTVDNGRDTKAKLEMLANGGTTLRDIYDELGANYRPKLKQWIRECLEFIQFAKELGASTELVKRWEDNLPLWRAHATGAGVAQPGEDAGKNGTDGTDGTDGTGDTGDGK